jgi:hypothetical protein
MGRLDIASDTAIATSADGSVNGQSNAAEHIRLHKKTTNKDAHKLAESPTPDKTHNKPNVSPSVVEIVKPPNPKDDIEVVTDGCGNFLQIDTCPYPNTPHEIQSSGPEVPGGQAQKRAPRAELIPNEIYKNAIEKKYGVYSRVVKDTQTYYANIDGIKKDLLSVSKNNENLPDVEKQLHSMIETREKIMEDKYGVRIIRDGQLTGLDTVKGSERTPISARQPKFEELAAVERGFEKSAVSLRDHSKTPNQEVVINFLDQHYLKGASAFYTNDDGKPTISIEPIDDDDNKHIPATELGAEKLAENGGRDWTTHTLEALLEHEIGHHALFESDWDNPLTKQTIARSCGWLPYKDAQSQTKWMVQTANGEFYKPLKNYLRPESWMRCDENGHAIDKNKRVIPDSKAIVYTERDVDNMPRLRFVGHYPNPDEYLADGIKFFRLNQESRENLIDDDPRLYAAVKLLDQKEIDKSFGPGFIRDLDGNVIRTTREAEDSIKRLESSRLSAT